MVAFPDYPSTDIPSLSGRGASGAARHCTARHGAVPRLVVVCIGVGLCMAAPGLWLVPTADPATQLWKLFVSVILFGMGVGLLQGSATARQRRTHATPSQTQPRVRQYDARGRARLRKS